MSALYIFILVVHAILAVALVVIVLFQRSEGGVLGIGGGSGGLMTARGAADLFTIGTRWLATGFVITSISLAAVAARDRKGSTSFADELSKKGAVVETAPAKTAKPSSGAPEVPVPNMQVPNLQMPAGTLPGDATPVPAAPAPDSQAPGKPSKPAQ